MNHTVLVTGGAGFVGSHTVVELLLAGHQVVVVDNCVNSAAPPANIAPLPSVNGGHDKDDTVPSVNGGHDKDDTVPFVNGGHDKGDTVPSVNGEHDKGSPALLTRRGVKHLPPSLARVHTITGKEVTAFYTVSLLDRPALSQIFVKHKVDVVIHFAALKAVGESVEMPLTYYVNNVTGTLTLLEVMSEAGVKKIVYSSSATVYGTPQYLPTDERHPTGQGVTNPYGHTKHFCEQIMKDLATADKEWQVVLLRYFNPVGAHESGMIGEDPRGPPNNLLPYIAQVAVGKREILSVYGDDYDTADGTDILSRYVALKQVYSTGVRDYIHVMDLAGGHVAALDKMFSEDFKGSVAYNLGTGRGVSVLEMVDAFTRKIPYKIVGRREGDVATMVACCALAELQLGWRATRDLNQMCADAWRWQSQNPDGYV
ncbi:UDP-glucose 4-epimerase-like 2 [Homarus americanus]|uniref:UDP-N-acetylglucosamine 4-epimerase n=1 Tax=Homarus americanus TaxID=6706 RepID=A0A8J5JXJ5_HOMAM|nr:UDP-glucose 4-epimerase-like 2 [Homarus americanus]